MIESNIQKIRMFNRIIDRGKAMRVDKGKAMRVTYHRY